jgi:hypothetical protein
MVEKLFGKEGLFALLKFTLYNPYYVTIPAAKFNYNLSS